MTSSTFETNSEAELTRASELLSSYKDEVYRRTDRLFIFLMLAQWLGGIVAALWITPKTWTGTTSSIHIHVWAAIFLGGVITSLPLFFALRQSGQVLTRHVIAVAQMLMSSLLIHLTGGRIETHFHVFGSLAFLAFYRDWKVLLSATIVVTLDHFIRGVYWPQSVFGILTSSHWRWMEHAGWVLFEDIFLFISIQQSLTDMKNASSRQASVEMVNHAVEKRVIERTQELRQEIRDRMTAEDTLRDREELLRATLESTADGILAVDANGYVTHWNTKFCEMWRTPIEVMETRDRDKMLEFGLTQMKDPEKFRARIKEIYASTEESYDIIECIDGRAIERVSCPLLRNGKLEGRVSSFRDITKQREAEQAKQQLQEQLDRSQRMESLGLLAGGVAHDLNNMLGPVVGYSEMLVRDLPDNSIAAIRARRIGKSAEEAATVIQDLLTLARRGRYEMCPVDLNTTVQSYLDSPAFEKLKEMHPNVVVTISLNPSAGTINGSNAHLAKAVMNLVTNACEAMANGGSLSISTERRHFKTLYDGFQNIEPGNYSVIRVKDTGQGVAKEDLSRIFEPYFSKKKMGQSGSGLGLSVVYGIVKDHKGYYDILSEIGVGTEFILYFPASDSVAVSKETGKIRIVGGSERILIVDDSPEQRALSQEIIQSFGYTVATAVHGHAGVEALREQSFDLIVLDMIMEPGFDGLVTYQEMLKINPNQRAIIVSGFSENDRVQAAVDLGAAGFIRKPYKINALAAAIRDALNKPKLAVSRV